MIVDIHTHVFPEKIADAAIAVLEQKARMKAYARGTSEALLTAMNAAGVDFAVTQPVATSPKQVGKLNALAAEAAAAGGRLIPFGAAHPDDPDWHEGLDALTRAGVKGVKIHPMYQETDLDDPRFLRILERAAELGLYVMVHAGEDVGIPGPARCAPRHVRNALRETGIRTLILAHMGGWGIWDLVEREIAGLPVYLDTSFAFRPVRPHPAWPRREDELPMGDRTQLVRILRKHGAERVLFGSDSPWGDPGEELSVLRGLGLEETELEAVCGGNAARLLGL